MNFLAPLAVGRLAPIRRPPSPPATSTSPEEHTCVRCQRDFACTELGCLGLTFTLCPPCREAFGLAA